MRRNNHGTESVRGTATSASGSAVREMSSFILKLRSSPPRLTGSARKYAGTTELDTIRRSARENKDTREGMVAGAKHLPKSLERAVGLENATKKGQVQEFFYKKLQRRPGQPMAE